MIFTRPGALVLTLLTFLPGISTARASTPLPRVSVPTATAFRTGAQVRIDGRMDEDVWRQAAAIGSLVQQVPNEGAAASEASEIRVVYTETTIYLGIVCRDRTPSAIIATQLTRDADLGSDDNITVVLDPFFDHRNGFVFQVNPAGARVDGQIANNAQDWSREWDGIWEAAARITPDGWVAEIAIPFKTLRFKPGQTVWGLNIERTIKRRNETDRWASALRDVWIGNLSQAGQLEGLETFEISPGVVIPVGSYRMNRWGIQAETADKRRWVARAEVNWGEFYSGTRTELQAGVTVKPTTHVAMSVEWEWNTVALREGTFRTDVVTARADYNFSTDVSWANLVQYDSESRLLGVQSRFRWILKPGNDLFLVLNRGWYHREFDSQYLPSFDKGSLKLQYTFRL